MSKRRLSKPFLGLLLGVTCLLSLFPVKANAAVDLTWLAGDLKTSLVSYLPLDQGINDELNNTKVSYYDAKTEAYVSAEEFRSDMATFGEGFKETSAITFQDGAYWSQDAKQSSHLALEGIDFDSDFTVSMLAKGAFTAPYENYQVLFGNRDWQFCDDGNGLLVSFLKNGPFSIVSDVKAGSHGRISGPRPSIADNEADANAWHLFTLTGDRTKGLFCLYVDGVKVIEQSYPESIGETMNSNQPLKIGTDGEGHFGYYGSIDDVMIFDEALGKTSVAALAKAYDFEIPQEPLTYEVSKAEVIKGKGEITISLSNEGVETVKNVQAEMLSLGDGKIKGERNFSFEEIAPGEKVSFQVPVQVKRGSLKLFCRLNEPTGERLMRAGFVASGKAGWISGDSHNHTRHSDGSGTIESNFAQAARQGIDYVTITDHSNSHGWEEAQVSGATHGIIPLRGNEYSGAQYTHAVFMGVEEEKNYSGLNPWEAVAEFKKDTEGRGLAWAAHPYDGRLGDGTYNPATGWDSWDQAWEADIDGIEVWNAWYAGNYKVNAEARVKWDELNRAGRHLYGIATTDTHSSRYIGEAYSTVLVKDYTAEGIMAAHRAGHLYGSNGPVIGLSVGKAIMGDDVTVKGTKQVTVKMTAEYIEPLSKIRLIKNGEVILERALDSSSVEMKEKITVKPGDFIRMEVDGRETETRKLDGPSFDTSAPFAFSNPIFFQGK